jgi:hypothetical protein
MKRVEFLVLSFEVPLTHPLRVGDGEWELKTHNSKLNTDEVVS